MKYRFIRVWEGVIQNGRDMGYPETKTRLYSSIESLIQDEYNSGKGVVYEIIVIGDETVEEIKKVKGRMDEAEKQRRKNEIKKQMKMLEQQMKELEN